MRLHVERETVHGVVPLGKVAGASAVELALRLEGLRRERTGLHGTLYVLVRGEEERLLAWSYLNIERQEDRGALARRAYRMLGEGLRQAASELDMLHWLDWFCAHAWPALLETYAVEQVEGERGAPAVPLMEPPLVIEGGGTILYAQPGRGKSYSALTLAVALDAGVEAGPLRPLGQLPVLYINLERDARSLRRRLAAVNAALGLPERRPLWMLNARGRTLVDIYPRVARFLREHEVGLVVLDSISRAGMGSLVEDVTANRVMDALNSLGVAWLALAHTPRGDETHAYGSIHQDAAADICVQLLSQACPGKVGVLYKCTKANDLPLWGASSVLCFEFEQEGLVAVREGRPGEFPALEEEMGQTLGDQIEAVLRQAGILTVEEIARELGRDEDDVRRTLNRDRRFVATGSAGRRKLWGLRPEPQGEEEPW